MPVLLAMPKASGKDRFAPFEPVWSQPLFTVSHDRIQIDDVGILLNTSTDGA